jgi:L-ascorbate metabolism protein UlaG (beta-lactamase superfamily)
MIFLAVLAGSAGAQSSASPSNVRATFLGVTTILLDDGETAVMTDGFFSRPSLMETMTRAISPNHVRIDDALRRAGVTRLAAVMVAHSHHDHAMDAPVVAAKTGAVLIGSKSTANIARGLDFPEEGIREIKGGESFTFGRFKIAAIKSPHSPGAVFPGEIAAPLRPPVRVSEYKEGGNYSFLVEHENRRVLIYPSANFAPGIMRGVKADVVFLGIGTLGKQGARFATDYWREIVQATGARLVIPIHWDNFFKPLDQPLEPLPGPIDDVERGMKGLAALAQANKVAVRRPRAFETIDLFAARP